SVNLKGGNPKLEVGEFERDNNGNIVKVVFKETIFKKNLDEFEKKLQESNPDLDLSVQEEQKEYQYNYYSSDSNPQSIFVVVKGSTGHVITDPFAVDEKAVIEIRDSKVFQVWNIKREIFAKEKKDQITSYYKISNPDLKDMQIVYYEPNQDNPALLELKKRHEIVINNRNNISSITEFSFYTEEIDKRKKEFKYYYENDRPIATERYEIEFDDKGEQLSEKLRNRMTISPSK
ncbi:MAG TPA: hypothetical protein DCP54_05870, partial [Chryseobacterium sp.]|nr:hypothetical protein [Chryseobacterium sp.]